MDQRIQPPPHRLAGFVLALCTLGTVSAASANETLTLRINDAEAQAGGLVPVVIRTYAPRSVSQGQICLRSPSGGQLTSNQITSEQRASGRRTSDQQAAVTGVPFVTLEEAVVLSQHGDAVVVETFDDAAQTVFVSFESLSASINETDGPLAVLWFRVHGSLSPDEEFQLELDLNDTVIVDASGEAVPLELRGGKLRIREPDDKLVLTAGDATVVAGDVAELAIETTAMWPLGSGQVTLTYDPAFAAGSPTVTMDERHGLSSYTVDSSNLGRVVVNFISPDGSLNEIPGELMTIALPTSTFLPPGKKTDLELDQDLTFLDDPGGGSIPLDLKDGRLEVIESDTGPAVMNFTSIDHEDGWVRESGEFSNAGGRNNSSNSGNGALRAGDDRHDRQYKGIASFDTSSIPNGATILSATLRLRRGTVKDGSPFATHGSGWVDVHSGGFGGSTSLSDDDFEAVADVARAASLSNAASDGDWSEASLDPVGLTTINKTGTTQLRVYFDLDDNDNGADDYIGFQSGDHTNSGKHPQLVVTYEE